MIEDIKSLVEKEFLQKIKCIRFKPYTTDLDVSDIIDFIENTICCLFASVDCIDAIKSIFPNNSYISDVNYHCFHSEFVANFGHSRCIATSGYTVFLIFYQNYFQILQPYLKKRF